MYEFLMDWEDAGVDEQLMHGLMHLSRVQFILMHRIQEKRRLYPGQPMLLSYLYSIEKARQPAPSQRDLAQHLHIRPATLTVTLQRLETTGLIVREADPADARVQRVGLTEKGRLVYRSFRQDFKEETERIFGQMQPAQKEQMLRCIDEMNRYLAYWIPHSPHCS